MEISAAKKHGAVAAFKAPKRIVLSTAPPKTERGKLDRKALAAG
jgi:non-ribosomal peptide synthetase component E (peptide arylation enzyme)